MNGIPPVFRKTADGCICATCGYVFPPEGGACPNCPYGSVESAPPIVCVECGAPIEGEWRRRQVDLCYEHRLALLRGSIRISAAIPTTDPEVTELKVHNLDGTTGKPDPDLPRPSGPRNLKAVRPADSPPKPPPSSPGVKRDPGSPGSPP